jgi:O-antigen/teichoic acid export membrane protein
VTPAEGQQAIQLAALAIGLRWPVTFYSGGLMGLQKQVLQNLVVSTCTVLQAFGAVLVLLTIAPTIRLFFVWQATMAVVTAVWARQALWKSLPDTDLKSRFVPSLFRSLWRFTAGAGAFTITSMMLNQADKVILSKMVSLENFGYYNLASTASGAVYLLAGPIFSALFPRFSALVKVDDRTALNMSYHGACELVSVLICPVAVFCALFSAPILLLWTRNVNASAEAHTIMSFLMASAALNALVYVPYALQSAYGWTMLAVTTNLSSLAAAAVLLPLLISYHGAAGAAEARLIINACVFLIVPVLMHRRILVLQAKRWYLADIGMPLVAALLGGVLAAKLGSARWLVLSPALFLMVALVAVFAVTVFAAPRTRESLLGLLRPERSIGGHVVSGRSSAGL